MWPNAKRFILTTLKVDYFPTVACPRFNVKFNIVAMKVNNKTYRELVMLLRVCKALLKTQLKSIYLPGVHSPAYVVGGFLSSPAPLSPT